VWVRTYNNSAPTGVDFDFNIPAPGTITVWSDAAMLFDEIRVQSYGANISVHSESQFGAASIDNIIVGTLVPEPSTMLLLGSGLAGLGWYRRRRKVPKPARVLEV